MRVRRGQAITWSIYLHRLARDPAAALVAMRLPDPREEEPQVVVDLGDGADGGSGVLRGGLLLDGDGGGEPLDALDVGLPHLLEELPGVGRQALDVAALPLGVDRVEGERGFAGAREPGDHDEPIARDRDVDPLQVVLPRAAHDDVIDAHEGPSAMGAPSRPSGTREGGPQPK
jgi:hypothetical protein